NCIMFGHRLEYCNYGDPNFGFNDWDATPDQTGTYHPQPGFGYASYFSLRCPQPDTGKTCYTGPNNQKGGGLLNLTGGYPAFVHGSLPFQIQPRTGSCDPQVLASPHSGVMLVGQGDGSVRTVSPSISTTTWLNVCIPDSGAVLGSDW